MLVITNNNANRTIYPHTPNLASLLLKKEVCLGYMFGSKGKMGDTEIKQPWWDEGLQKYLVVKVRTISNATY